MTVPLFRGSGVARFGITRFRVPGFRVPGFRVPGFRGYGVLSAVALGTKNPGTPEPRNPGTSSTLFVVCVLALGSLFVQPSAGFQSPVAGPWSGTIDLPGVSLKMRVVFTPAGQGLTGTIDIPQQGATGLPLRDVRVDGANVRFELPTAATTAVFAGVLSEKGIAGTFTQGPATGTFSLTRAVVSAPPPPPPYREENVTFANGSVTLAGTLTLPEGAGPFPAVVLITGSGAQTRDEEVFGFKVFQVLADHLTRQGIAVLRYDDRGVGGSTGSIPQSTTADFAGDALSGLALLQARPEIARASVGLVGHSEGAVAAAIAAARSRDVAFVVLVAGTGVRGDEVLRQQARDAARALGASESQIDGIVAAHRQMTDAAIAGAGREALSDAAARLIRAQVDGLPPAQRAAVGDVDAFVQARAPAAVTSMMTPWMRFLLTFDPATALAQVTCPVLAVFGAKDIQVPPSLNRKPVEASLAKNTRTKVVEYPTANHLFQDAITGQVAEYQVLDKAFVAGFLADLTSWIRETTRR